MLDYNHNCIFNVALYLVCYYLFAHSDIKDYNLIEICTLVWFQVFASNSDKNHKNVYKLDNFFF